MISFEYLLLYFAEIQIVICFFNVSCYNLYMVHVLQEWGSGIAILIKKNK